MQKTIGKFMNNAITRGKGKAKKFLWELSDNRIFIKSESNVNHQYSIPEISAALMWLQCKFGSDPFPLANNVEKMHNGQEKNGLGLSLYAIRRNLSFAQGSSYLGVVLEYLGIFEFVEDGVISWRLAANNQELGALIDMIKEIA